MKQAISITHLHLLGVVLSQLEDRKTDGPVRLLDVGCGNGELMAYLHASLLELCPADVFEIFGLDVIDHGVQESGFFDETKRRLSAEYPDVDWVQRLVATKESDPWPFEDQYFDAVLSNQVLEHVNNHDRFFAELFRCLRDNGWSTHLFPVKEVLFEGHLYIPLAHRIYNHDLRKSWIKSLSRLRFGKYPLHSKKYGVGLDEYSERHADYLLHYTNYISSRELCQLTKKHGFRASFRYTQEFYAQKIRSVLGLAPRYQYRRKRSAFIDWLLLMLLKRTASITLLIEKRESYRGL